MTGYDSFFHDVIDGQYGITAAYWATYVYLINRVNRELQRAVPYWATYVYLINRVYRELQRAVPYWATYVYLITRVNR
ncbi:hypothetical protein LSAT2_017542, partial [Lamellibrachia satsuma]